MDLSVAFLGTGGSAPTARRSTASLLVRAGGERLMFDCGEGTQRQMQRSTGLVPVGDLYLTHLHADHFLGLPGLIKTYDLVGRTAPMRLFGPAGLGELVATLRRVVGRVSYPLTIEELADDDIVGYDSFEVRAFAVEHRVRAFGYALVEDERPGRFDPDEAIRLGVEPGPAFGALQGGETVTGTSGPIEPDQVMGPSRPGRRIVISGDTAPCSAVRAAADGAQLLIHEASFVDEELERAIETGHSTARQAAAVAHDAGVELLALVHISSRYHVGRVLDEAGEEFEAVVAPRDFDLIEIPFPERGAPVLIPDGARDPDAQSAHSAGELVGGE